MGPLKQKDSHEIANESNRKSYTIQELTPHLVRGDFDVDLHPAGPFHPNPLSSQSGSLMGPNHPLFRQPYHDDDMDEMGPDPFNPSFGGLGMQPRFDPYGPPGGPTDLHRNSRPQRGRPRRGQTNGNPNNDILKPPDLDHMFM